MFGAKNHKHKNSALDHKAQSQKTHNGQEKWDKLEQGDDMYCSDSFNIFNDIY